MRGSKKLAYNTDAEALSDAQARWAKEKFDAESKMHAETAHLLGIPLSTWMKRRTDFLNELAVRRQMYGDAPSGPFVDGSQSWHSDYRKLCTDGNVAILRHELTPKQLAEDVLTGFRDVLSAAAVARWESIAGGV